MDLQGLRGGRGGGMFQREECVRNKRGYFSICIDHYLCFSRCIRGLQTSNRVRHQSLGSNLLF
jgi:hypothetical protein